MNPVIFDFARPIGYISVAGGLYVAQLITPEVSGVPNWVTALGLPCAMLVAVIYALVSTNKQLRKSEQGRLDDRDSFVSRLERDVEKGAESRERLIHAAELQTAEIRRLADEMSRVNQQNLEIRKVADDIRLQTQNLNL